MSNKIGDIVWAGTLGAVVIALIVPQSRELFVDSTKAYPYIMGFLKVALLATMGELLAGRIVSGSWVKPVGLIWRSIIWGFFGVAFALVFPLFSAGTQAVIKMKLLPILEDGFAEKLSIAFWTSTITNLIFAPTFMAFHRITDTWIEAAEGTFSGIIKTPLSKVTSTIQWSAFIDFVVCRTIPIFWIPAHTVTFLLPPEYRVLSASLLSIALGGILGFAKKRKS
ncbi:MAG: hypothetical protein HQM10_04600 [Candidatus Riflebacteria bacterium]|nr:hypothetical protein [Candidatus Riflebacteria bacterium]